MDSQNVSSGFRGLGISQSILDILDKNKFITPTPIQHKSIPIAIKGTDIVGIAQTGTGKTLAFGIPLLQQIGQLKGAGKGLVVLPTRELASQVNDVLRKIGGPLGLRTAVLIGGERMPRQLDQLRRKPHVIVATPGRLNDHVQQRTVHLGDVKMLVLDEADRMFDMGFAPQIARILKEVPKERQTMLFSATMPAEIVKIATTHMHLPLHIEVAPQGTAAETVEQEIFIVKQKAKFELLVTLLQQYKGTVLVFSRTKHNAKRICGELRMAGYQAAEIHSNRSLAQRRSALEGFKTGRFRILVATDIAARGIDVKNIELVVNFDLPDAAEDYVHRIGRTGRAGKNGRAISFAMPSQKRDVMAIERLIRKQLPVANKETAEFSLEDTAPFRSNRRFSRGGSRGFSGPRRPGSGSGFRSRRPFSKRNSSRPGASRGGFGGNRNQRGGNSYRQQPAR